MCDGRDTRVSDLSARGWWQDPPSSTRPSSWQDTAPDLRHLLPAGALSLSLSLKAGRPVVASHNGVEAQRPLVGRRATAAPPHACHHPVAALSPARLLLPRADGSILAFLVPN
jgi:hypothetical protein